MRQISNKYEFVISCQVKFQDAFELQSDGKRLQKNLIEKYPGQNYEIRIAAPPGTRLGLLGVDKSVYLLRNENRLTKERVSKGLSLLDII